MVDILKSDIFKSQFNKTQDEKAAAGTQKKVQEISSSPVITIEPNTSVCASIKFAEAFECAPFVFYSVMCADRSFAINHYITDIKANGFELCIENQAMVTRHITVQYFATLK